MQVRRPDGSVRDFFVYAATTFTFAAAGTTPFNIPVQSDADFELAYITANVSSLVTPSASLMVTDNGGNRRLFNVPVNIDMVAGSGQRPYVLPESHIFARNGAILLEVTNLIAGANVVNVALHGWKWFTAPPNLVV